jgi:putative FmdB family regulatory protein
MPIYTYRCTECGVQFERHQSFTDTPLVKCPECGKKSLRKVFTPAGIIFKGSGWYATDNRSPSGQGTSRDKAESTSTATSDSGATPAPAAAEKTPAPAASTDSKV